MRDALAPQRVADLPLFSPRVPARRSDPAPSQDAATEMIDSGRIKASAMAVLQALVIHASAGHQPPTARELGRREGLVGHEQAHKRLPELEAAGYVTRDLDRHCGVSGKTASTWKPTFRGIEASGL